MLMFVKSPKLQIWRENSKNTEICDLFITVQNNGIWGFDS